MRLRIQPTEKSNLKLTLASSLDQLVQQTKILLSTSSNSVPGYREFGIDMSYLHLPINAAKTAFAGAIADAVDQFIPGMSVVQVEFEDDANSPEELKPIIEVMMYEPK